MMTRKHFRGLAEALLAIDDETDRLYVATKVSDVCEKDNPRFDRRKFYEACDVLELLFPRE